MKSFRLLLILPFILFLNSCLGFDIDISLNQNNTGTINMEYLVSRSLDSLGRLDGNERWNTIPAGRADFERTIDRLPGLKLLSFSSSETEKNLVTRTKMEFSRLEGLMAFLDPGALRSSVTGDSRSGSLTLYLAQPSERKDPALDKLIADAAASYSIKMSMSFPNEGTLSVTNSKGLPVAVGEIITQGKRVSFSFPLNELLSSPDGIIAEFRW
jgi:hypothetical protein